MLMERERERDHGYSACPSKCFGASYGWIDKMNEGSKEINKKSNDLINVKDTVV